MTALMIAALGLLMVATAFLSGLFDDPSCLVLQGDCLMPLLEAVHDQVMDCFLNVALRIGDRQLPKKLTLRFL